ncbi:hypothetical protein [Peterkaempfera griseoplana]|uniref:hypothetical protein n=1 Tax=Peterkaempfera griseoplana TaxID=66896 RepID=UPI0006E3FDFD|nr:hypothetical protein [Peterkaempfera griseoplana]
MPLDEQYLTEVEQRHAAAERGWHLVTDPENICRYRIDGDGPTVVAVFDSDDAIGGTPSYMTEENAEFAVHAHRDVPRLVDEVRRLQSALTRCADSDDPAEKLRAELELQRVQMQHLQKESSGVLRSLDKARRALEFAERTTIPNLRREVERQQGGKQRWRERALTAERTARSAETTNPGEDQS